MSRWIYNITTQAPLQSLWTGFLCPVLKQSLYFAKVWNWKGGQSLRGLLWSNKQVSILLYNFPFYYSIKKKTQVVIIIIYRPSSSTPKETDLPAEYLSSSLAQQQQVRSNEN